MTLSDKINHMSRQPHNPVLRVNRKTMQMEYTSNLIPSDDNEIDLDWDMVANWFETDGEDQEITNSEWAAFEQAVGTGIEEAGAIVSAGVFKAELLAVFAGQQGCKLQEDFFGGLGRGKAETLM